MDNHIVITSFNKQRPPYDKDKAAKLYEGSPSWMDERIILFKKYYISSFLNQSDSDHHNFIMCDTSTPKKYREEFTDLEKNYPFLNFIYNKEPNSDKKTLSLIIDQYKKKRKNNSDTILTSRVDNDDMVGKQYNQEVKENLKSREWITFSEGLCINHFDHSVITYLRFHKSPFVSRKTNINNPETPYGWVHHDVPSDSIYTNPPIWAQVIHGSNLDNKLRGPRIKLSSTFMKNNFNLA